MGEKTCESEEDADEEVDLEVVLDDEGRVTGTSTIGLNFEFYSCENSFLTSSTVKDVVSVLKSDVDAVFDGCTTFWLPATNFEPRTTFERLAKQIFDFHTKNISSNAEIDWANSGAEYWTQKRDLNGTTNLTTAVSDDGVLKNDNTVIRFHFDKDEELVDQTDGAITVHPQISTITYLTDGGNPTLIFPHKQEQPSISQNDDDDDDDDDDNVSVSNGSVSIDSNEDEDEKEEEDGDGDGEEEGSENGEDGDDEEHTAGQCDDTPDNNTHIDSKVTEVFASFPKLGKHVSFDGRFLHGCPSALTITDPPDGMRMTFLVNIWLNWKPLGPEIFSDEDLSLVSNVPVNLEGLVVEMNNKCDGETIAHMHLTSESLPDETTSCHAMFGPQGWDHILTFDWPSKESIRTVLQAAQNSFSSLCLHYSPDRPCQVRPTCRPIMKSVPCLEYTCDITVQDVVKLFQQSKLLLIKNYDISPSRSMTSLLESLGDIYRHSPNEVKKNWLLKRKPVRNADMFTPEVLFGRKDAYAQSKRKKRKTDNDNDPVLSVGDAIAKTTDTWEVTCSSSEATAPNSFQDILSAFCTGPQTGALSSLFSSSGSNNNNNSVATIIASTPSVLLSFGRRNIKKSKQCFSRGVAFDEDSADTMDTFIATGTCYKPLHGSTSLLLKPNESQDWSFAPPPIISSGKSLRVDVREGDVLLVSNQFWLTEEAPLLAAAGDDLLYFTVSRDFSLL